MKSILIAIQPYWVFLIIAKIMGWEIDQEKTVEVRKTFPKDLNWNKKSIIYCSENKQSFNRIPKKYQPLMVKFLGKVIGEFVCDKIDDFYCASIPYRKENNLGYGHFIDNGVYKVDGWHEGVVFERSGPRIDTMLKNTDLENMCLSAQEIFDYIGIGKHLYGWHITDLVIYDKPKELGEFYRECEEYKCDNCPFLYVENTPNCYETWCEVGEKIPITRPPQSWCYVEEMGV